MGGLQSLPKDLLGRYDTIQVKPSSTKKCGKSLHKYKPIISRSKLSSVNKNADHDHFSSDESFKVENEFENEAEISKMNGSVAGAESDSSTRFYLNHFQDSNDIYQHLHWRTVDASPEKQKPPKTIGQELKELSSFTWYWGPMSSKEAERQLEGKPDGSFLVRDSLNSRHLLSVSFRSKESCCHTRIQCKNKKFSFFANEEGKDSVIELLEKAMSTSREGVLFYSRRQLFQDIWYPVRLLHPVSRITKVPSLQFLCRFVIRKNTRCDKLHELPLPKAIIEFLHGNYFREEEPSD